MANPNDFWSRGSVNNGGGIAGSGSDVVLEELRYQLELAHRENARLRDENDALLRRLDLMLKATAASALATVRCI